MGFERELWWAVVYMTISLVVLAAAHIAYAVTRAVIVSVVKAIRARRLPKGGEALAVAAIVAAWVLAMGALVGCKAPETTDATSVTKVSPGRAAPRLRGVPRMIEEAFRPADRVEYPALVARVNYTDRIFARRREVRRMLRREAIPPVVLQYPELFPRPPEADTGGES